MKRIVFALAILGSVTGCSTMTPPRYSISVDTNQALEEYQGQHVVLARLDAPVSYGANCRLMGPIRGAGGRTIPQYVRDAYNDEFRFADIYGENGTRLTGKLDGIAFSSTGGWWLLAITLRSPEGESLSVEQKYEFGTGFNAITACSQTAQALGAAVQDLVYATVTHPDFDELIQ